MYINCISKAENIWGMSEQIDSLKKRTPKGKIVYGGGGIMPDIYVPIQQISFGDTFYSQNGIEIANTFIIDKVSKSI